jgi:Flp pilus assembly protein TadG
MSKLLNNVASGFAGIIHDVSRLRADQRGNVAIMAGLLMVPFVGSLGVAFEVSDWYMATRAMQNAADAAAIAAATNAGSNYNIEGKAVASQYGYVDGTNNVTVTASNTATCPTRTPALTPPCYSVTITSVVPLYLSQVVGYTGSGANVQNLSSTAIANNPPNPQAICLLALSQTGTALRTNGAPNSNFSGCTVMSDSASTCNGSNLNATWGLAHTTNSGCGNNQRNNIPIVSDPYKAMASNIPANTCGSYPQESKKGSLPASNQLSGSKSWSGTVQMCGDVQLTGNVTINTGTAGAVLVIENGQLDPEHVE